MATARGAFVVLLVVAGTACRSRAPSAVQEPDAVATATIPPVATDAAVPIASAEPPPVAEDAGCTITLGQLLAANVYTGVRDSPSRQAAKDHLDPGTRARWDGRDHGVKYLLCKYAVQMNGHAFTYEHVAGQSITQTERLDTATCATAATRAEVAKEVRSSTKECSDPHAGAYWGFDLVPVP